MAAHIDPFRDEEVNLLQLPQEVLELQQELQRPSSTLPPEAAVAAQPDCALLQLPSEIRNRIYEYSLLDDVDDECIVEVRKTYRTPTLLSTCRQIRSEAGNLYYGTATFLLRAERGGRHRFVHRNPPGFCLLWLATRAFQESKQIRTVCLDLYTPRSLTTGWMDVWTPIALAIVRDKITDMRLGEGIKVSAWMGTEY